MKTKFKPLDLVQSNHDGEIEMVLKVFSDNVATYLVPFGVGLIDLNTYKKISPKKVKFNLK